MSDQRLSEMQRKEVFLALVQAQDRALTVAASRREVALRFGISERHVQLIEQEGLDKVWPPL